MKTAKPISERFWTRVVKTDGCWLWTACPVIDFGGRSKTAPRVAWELTYGNVADGLSIFRKCNNRICVRPDHLELRKDRSTPIAKRFWRYVEKGDGDGCWLWRGAIKANGYGAFGRDVRRRVQSAHRVAWELTNGPIPSGLCVLHKCDIRNCVRPDHLWLGTNQDNVDDMYRKGRSYSGDDHHAAKLNSCKVEEIRRRYKVGGISQLELATEYGVRENAIYNLLRYRTWRKDWIKDPERIVRPDLSPRSRR